MYVLSFTRCVVVIYLSSSFYLAENIYEIDGLNLEKCMSGCNFLRFCGCWSDEDNVDVNNGVCSFCLVTL
jgi:hypothetical protein